MTAVQEATSLVLLHPVEEVTGDDLHRVARRAEMHHAVMSDNPSPLFRKGGREKTLQRLNKTSEGHTKQRANAVQVSGQLEGRNWVSLISTVTPHLYPTAPCQAVGPPVPS